MHWHFDLVSYLLGVGTLMVILAAINHAFDKIAPQISPDDPKRPG